MLRKTKLKSQKCLWENQIDELKARDRGLIDFITYKIFKLALGKIQSYFIFSNCSKCAKFVNDLFLFNICIMVNYNGDLVAFEDVKITPDNRAL